MLYVIKLRHRLLNNRLQHFINNLHVNVKYIKKYQKSFIKYKITIFY